MDVLCCGEGGRAAKRAPVADVFLKDLHIFSDGAESLLLILVLDGRLDGFEKVALGLEDLFDGLDPLASGLLTGAVADERAAVLVARRARGAR